MMFPVLKSVTVAALPTILINWVFGSGVIQYPIGRPRPVVSAFWSMLIFLAYLNVVRIAGFQEIRKIQGSIIAANNYRTSAYLCLAYVATSICLAYFRSKIVQGTLTKCTNMNTGLSMLGIPNDYQSAYKSQIVHICLAFAWNVALMAMDFKYAGFEFPSEMSRFGFFLTFHYYLMFGFVVDCGFTANIRYFGNRFHRLNELLIELESVEKTRSTFAQSGNEFLSYSSVIREVHGNNSPSIEAANKKWLLHVIRETRKIHRHLCKAATDLNRAFGIQLLFSVALSFFLITTLLYTSYILNTSNNSIQKTWQEKVIVLMWITFHAMKVLLIVDACVTTTSEANLTGRLLATLLNTRCWDEDIGNEINIFSLQLLQNPLSFTASELFTLNYSLVCGIIGSVTTYLVIMIQMRSIYEPEDMISKSDTTMSVRINSTD